VSLLYKCIIIISERSFQTCLLLYFYRISVIQGCNYNIRVCVHRFWWCDNKRACASMTWRAHLYYRTVYLLSSGRPPLSLPPCRLLSGPAAALVSSSMVVVRIITLDASVIVVDDLDVDVVHRDNVIPKRATGPPSTALTAIFGTGGWSWNQTWNRP